ncbi:MAG TPA: caspase family protein [Planctomycetota bacterium]|nr:caspase family protein [Planctomycetota bacterium]
MCIARFVLLASGFLPLFGLIAEEGIKHALLVGVQDYKGTGLSNLKYSENDVHGLAELLPNLGYLPDNVVLLTRKLAREKDNDALRPTAGNIRKWLADICKNANSSDTVLVSFAGHGVQLKASDKMYFCPLECDLAKSESLISLDEIYATMEKDCKAGVKVLLVDACRNDPLDGRAVGDERVASITRPQIPDPPGGMAAFFSCSKGQKAFESDVLKHGVFFNCVIEALSGKAVNPAGEVTVPLLEDYLTRRVPEIVKKEMLNPDITQIPERRGTLRGTAVLAGTPGFQIKLLSAREYVKKEDYQKAIDEFEAAVKMKPDDEKIKAEFGDALYKLGQMYLYGKGNFVKSYSQAFELFKRGVQFGSPSAENALGVMYLKGYGVTQDYAEALRWYRKAADQGNAKAQYNLGVMFYNGNGVAQDDSEAVKLYRKSADQGYDSAQNDLGVCYYVGKGVPQDYAEALRWYRKAAEQGQVNAQSNLGGMYSEGRGVARDDAEAVKWYRKSADQDYANAQYNLGRMYEQGKGIARDDAEAVKWYRKSADQGFASAQYNLGSMFENGTGVAKDDAEAAKWYRKAADQGHPKGQFALGGCYEAGKGVAADAIEAVRWYRKAAEQGDADAQFFLGLSYGVGVGVSQDRDQAIEWFRKAAKQNHQQAIDSLRRLGIAE